MANVNGNLELKSDVFSMLMQDKRRALEVYNAINGTAYADPDVYNLEKAIQLAIDQCIREDVLKEFLQERGKEVMNVMTLDFSFERRLELQRAEAAEEGEKIGIHKILSEQIRKKLLKNKSLEQIADELEKTPENIQPIYEQIQKELMQNC